MKQNKYLIFAAMGTELVGIIVGCLFLAQKLEEVYHLKGLALVVLPMLGLAGWIVQIVILSKKMEKQDED